MRPPQGRLDYLEQKIDGIMDFIAANSGNSQGRANTDDTAHSSPTQAFRNTESTGASFDVASREESVACPPTMLTPRSTSAPEMDQMINRGAFDETTSPLPPTTVAKAGPITSSGRAAPRTITSTEEEASPQSHLSPREARIAGLDVGQDGGILVHGPSSMMHEERGTRDVDVDHRNEDASLDASKARLIVYAVIQRQRESFIYRQPPATMDLDGIDGELARHLLDLHWNRQHLAYLLTYRPAIMDSLANGGPWCNKLLLNAIYYTSCLYSDRDSLRKSPGDTQSAGDRFYDRFRALLVDEIVKPSVPSAAALLLIGASLVSQVDLISIVLILRH
jgi:hypothetical protein